MPRRRGCRGRSFIVFRKETELARVARGLRQAKVLERQAGEQSSARRALQEALLDQKRLDNVLDRITWLGECRCQRIDSHRPATVIFCDCLEVAAVHCIETHTIDLEG